MTADFFKMLDSTFGYLTKKGFCAGSDCQRFPVAIGEFGSRSARCRSCTPAAHKLALLLRLCLSQPTNASGTNAPTMQATGVQGCSPTHHECRTINHAAPPSLLVCCRFLDPKDIEHLNDFASYLNNVGPGATGQHNAIGNWMYWSWNANR